VNKIASPASVYEIREYNRKTKTYRYKQVINANTAEEAREIFIEENKWKPKKDITLFIKPANCR